MTASPAPDAPSPARRAVRRIVVAVGVATGLGLILGAVPAAAVDNSIVTASPAPNGTVDVAPTTLLLQFANPLGPTNSVNMTCGAQGQAANVVPLGTPIILADQVTLQVPVNVAIGAGVCNVVWRVTDPTLQPAGSSSFSFVVTNDPVVTTTVPDSAGAGQTGDTTTTVAGTAPVDPADEADDGGSASGPLGLFRWLANMSIAALFGSLLVLAVCWREGSEYPHAINFLRITWGVATASTYLFVSALAADVADASLGSALTPTGWGALLDTAHGKAAIIRLAFVLGTGYAVSRPERTSDPNSYLQVLGVPGIAVVTLAFDRPEFGPIEWVAGSIHAVAMAVWFGGLVFVTRVVLAWRGEEDQAAAVRGYARLSVPALWATVASGLLQLIRLDRGELGSDHGLVLVFKTLLVSVMVFVALAVRQYVQDHLARARVLKPSMRARLRRAVTIEAGIGVVVLLVTSWLLALTPPGLGRAEELVLDLGVPIRFSNEALGADVLVAFSEKAGVNDVRIEVIEPVEGLTGLQVDFLPPAASSTFGMTVDASALTGAGAAVLEKSDGFTLSSSGVWTVVVRIGTNEVARKDVFVGNELATP